MTLSRSAARYMRIFAELAHLHGHFAMLGEFARIANGIYQAPGAGGRGRRAPVCGGRAPAHLS
jgi:hypothetical protein